jgi:hypothetical protein
MNQSPSLKGRHTLDGTIRIFDGASKQILFARILSIIPEK